MKKKLFIQIPCLNEESTLPALLKDIRSQNIENYSVHIVVIDDGSSDKTFEVALSCGADYVERNTTRLGLAFTFRRAVDICLRHGADIIVNMDGDHQYRADQLEKLIMPLHLHEADLVVGERDIANIEDFSVLKKSLQHLGSWIVRHLSGVDVKDATSGFRAMTRDAALKLTILSNYTYTLESLLQAQSKGLKVVGIAVRSNPKTRDSRLMKSMRQYLIFSAATIIRIFSMYNPLRVFLALGTSSILLGVVLVTRFIYFYFTAGGAGKIQSLIIASIFILQGIFLILAGVLADLIQFNRRISEETLLRVKKLELSVKVQHAND